MKKIGIIIGSNRSQRSSLIIGQWLQRNLSDMPFDTELLDLGSVNLPWLDEPELPAAGHYQMPATRAWAKAIAACDGFIIVMPQYNGGYPAVLKNALDTVFAEWSGKPVGLVSFGGHGGGKAATALQMVFSFLKLEEVPTQLQVWIKPGALNVGDADAILAKYQSDFAKMADEIAEKI
ncbi:NADPH-dependent FMN reductase [Eupransor demetentiae]|uniref:NAD(P)H-dependent FMN reductase (SsuE) n=1 Tax=Eupransor demetentiae TaxID=3109584 RepID=A0ABM9N5J5_9LACO|nr:NAD(P)H-dependent FMN reductase (SsuE) [Lactobacillaceae bacterium LMG 33000]